MTAPAHAGSPPEGDAIAPCEPVPGLACVPGGSFIRGADRSSMPKRKPGDRLGEWPKETVWLPTFYMDVFEVTVERYDACVKSGRCEIARTRYRDFNRPKQPKVGVSWYHAEQFCRAQGEHLPTEAEWEKAARGTDGRTWPWGEKIATCAEAVIEDERGRSCGTKKGRGERPEAGRTYEVGTRPPNPYGLFDMAGNSWEWVADWASPSYEACGEACRGTDPKGPCGGGARPGSRRKVVRGGSWYWGAALATTTYRRAHVASNDPYHHFGFRCAASVEEARAIRASAQP